MVPAFAPPPHTAPSAAVAALKTAAAIHAEAAKALAGRGAEASRPARLRLRSALALRERHLGRIHPLSLATRGLYGLLLDKEGEPRGLKLHAEACGELHRLLKIQQRAQGMDSPELLDTLEALAELYGYENLKADRWEDRALAIRVRHSREPRPDLERRVVEALQRHYGGWLSFRPPDADAVLADAGRLLELWSRRKDAAGLTREFAETGLRSDATGVWRLVARKGSEELHLSLASLLDRLDAESLRSSFDAFLPWLGDQQGRPWEEQARALGRELERLLDLEAGRGAAQVGQRVRLAEALGDPARADQILAAALRGAETREELLSLWPLTQRILDQPHDGTLERVVEEVLQARFADLLSAAEGRRWIEVFARRAEAQGRMEAAERFWRALLVRAQAEDLGPPGPATLAWNLGTNLAAQGRLEEARTFLEPLLAEPLEGLDPRLRFLLSDLEARLGHGDLARLRAVDGLQRFRSEGQFQPVPGLADALRRSEADSGSKDLRLEVLAGLMRKLDPAGAFPALREPAKLLALVQGLEAGAAAPAASCGEPWIRAATGPQEQAEALLRAARELPNLDAVPCLRAALKTMEGAWGSEDPRLANPLFQLGKVLEVRQDPQAEPILRRLLALAEAQPDLDPVLRIEASVRLAHVLSEDGRWAAAEPLLRQALKLLENESLDEERIREVAGGAVLILLVRLEDEEDYPACLALLDDAAALVARFPGLRQDVAKDLEPQGPKLRRKAKVQALLRAQGLP